MIDDIEVVVVGAGAAGIAATRKLVGAGVGCLLVEARERVGGRALTVPGPAGTSMDLGCGWLHSADRNPFVGIAEGLGLTIDRSRPPWARKSGAFGFPPGEEDSFWQAQEALDERLVGVRDMSEDCAVSAFLEPGNRWNPLIEAISTYYSGAETENVSAVDLDRYDVS